MISGYLPIYAICIHKYSQLSYFFISEFHEEIFGDISVFSAFRLHLILTLHHQPVLFPRVHAWGEGSGKER